MVMRSGDWTGLRTSPVVEHVVGEGGTGGGVDHESAGSPHGPALLPLKQTTAEQDATKINLNRRSEL